MGVFGTHLSVLWALATLIPAQESADTALAALRAGNERFVHVQGLSHKKDQGTRMSLARGQNPRAIVLCCADSRVPPEHVFDAGLGELFVVRLAGNAVDEEVLASIEYAADHLGTRLCVVLGHERCGAIAASVDSVQHAGQREHGAAHSHALEGLLQRLEPAVRAAAGQQLVGKALCDKAEEENAQLMAVEVLRRSAPLQRLARSGTFAIRPARYHLDTGAVEWLPMRAVPEPEPEAVAGKAAAMEPSLAPHPALSLLQAGHRRFLSAGDSRADRSAVRREALTLGQHPFAIVIACADSRVAPELLFDMGLGDVFVVRVAGNVLNDDVLASIEYAAAHTGAPLIVVLGHSQCGAVKATAEQRDDAHLSPALRALVERIEPSVAEARRTTKLPERLLDAAVRANVLRTCAQARRQSALLQSMIDAGTLQVVPAVYDLATGEIEWLPEQAGTAAAEPHAVPGGETAPTHAAHSDHAATEIAANPRAEAHAPGHGEPQAREHGAEADHPAAPASQHADTTQGDGGDWRSAMAHSRTAWLAGLGLASAVIAMMLLRRRAG